MIEHILPAWNKAKGKKRVVKICSCDVEVGNFIYGLEQHGGTGGEAAELLINEIDGYPVRTSYSPRYASQQPTYRAHSKPQNTHNAQNTHDTWNSSDSAHGSGSSQPGSSQQGSYGGYAGYGGGYGGYGGGYGGYGGGYGNYYYNIQDRGRRYLDSNGGCMYIDLDHLEICPPEVISAYDHVATWFAMLRKAERARIAASEKLPEGQEVTILVNNSDGQGNSYGSHINFLISRTAWDNLAYRKLHHMMFLSSYQVSSIVFTGQGKVGSENDMPQVDYQLSQRADFFETPMGQQTTMRRPIFNTRDEALCGFRGFRMDENKASDELARLHVIFFDSTLCPVTCLLKMGVMQIILCLCEANKVSTDLILDDALAAVHMYSFDPSLDTACEMASGKKYTAVELQLRFLELAKPFVEAGHCDEYVPEARAILAMWEDTLDKLHRRDMDALAPRLDWVLKKAIIERAMEQNPDLTWDSPTAKHLDHAYSMLDPEKGLFWIYYNNGLVERVVSDEQIEHFDHEPPEDTRAWTRAMLLRRGKCDSIRDVDWDSIRIRDEDSKYWNDSVKFELNDPRKFTRATAQKAFENTTTLEELGVALEGIAEDEAISETTQEEETTSQVSDTLST